MSALPPNKGIVLSEAQGVIEVEVKGQILLRSIALDSDARMLLDPGRFDFYILDFDDGRPKREWAILLSDPTYGIPLKDLDILDENDRVAVRQKGTGKFYFEDAKTTAR